MSKTKRGPQAWLITHPAHAELAGTMAAHWGNEEFARPGGFAPSTDAERLRQEVTLAVAQHDNGWWEWEANPPLSAADGLPQNPGEVHESPRTGMERWLRGISRMAERHPYASLLIGDHAYCFYASQFDSDPPAEFVHQLQRDRSYFPPELESEARRLMAEVRGLQDALLRPLEVDQFWQTALQPQHRNPNARLLQTLDALSLALCSTAIAPVDGRAKGFGEDQVSFQNVPRRNWDDRVTLEITSLGDDRITIDPYPFDKTPLTVSVPARLAEPHTSWRQAPWILRQYTYLPI